ncbi:MAG TPA: LysR family transcriptional regulator [Acidimicrobiales bacterium]|nr:LysR family transcriptional regulator [Acidimicrobiales bacterium]
MTQAVDWNLLSALDVLLAEGSVTAAAERLHLSVPATSRTLGRIRQSFGDPILVRAGRGLVPTPRALAIQERLHRLIQEAHALVESGRDVDLASLERTFTIRANDALINILTPRLVAAARTSAPGVTLRFVPEGEEDLAPLRDGLIDLDVGVIGDFGPEVRVQALYEERLVGMVAAGRPLSSGRPTLGRIAAVEHVAVSRRGRTRGAFDDVLDQRGLARRVVVVVPTFSAAADIIASSELTGLISARYAAHAARLTGAHLYEIPAALPPLPLSQAWHVRHDLDPAHQWLRNEMAACLGLGSGPREA